jgi:hypothetical protein
MNNFFVKILQKHIKFDFNKHKPLLLGRWKIHENHDIALQKADMTNEDHCGICNKMRYDYIQTYNVSKKNKDSNILK